MAERSGPAVEWPNGVSRLNIRSKIIKKQCFIVDIIDEDWDTSLFGADHVAMDVIHGVPFRLFGNKPFIAMIEIVNDC